MIGILAYGSLIADPGEEIRNALHYRIEGVSTPFNVEYARRSTTRCNAPTMVPVPEGVGSPVKGAILILKAAITEEEARNMLYRREIHETGSNKTYNHEHQKKKCVLFIKSLKNFHGIPFVIYTHLKPNIAEILDLNLSDEKKAEMLAEAAIKSITSRTYKDHKDGIWYLYQNIQSRIITPLTEPYKNEILRRANGAADLLSARDYFPHQKDCV